MFGRTTFSTVVSGSRAFWGPAAAVATQLATAPPPAATGAGKSVQQAKGRSSIKRQLVDSSVTAAAVGSAAGRSDSTVTAAPLDAGAATVVPRPSATGTADAGTSPVPLLAADPSDVRQLHSTMSKCRRVEQQHASSTSDNPDELKVQDHVALCHPPRPTTETALRCVVLVLSLGHAFAGVRRSCPAHPESATGAATGQEQRACRAAGKGHRQCRRSRQEREKPAEHHRQSGDAGMEALAPT